MNGSYFRNLWVQTGIGNITHNNRRVVPVCMQDKKKHNNTVFTKFIH